MQNLPPEYSIRTRRSSSVRLGYVRLLDAAPLIVADSLGMFRDTGLDVELSREVGWATIRDKLAFGELDVVQALSPLPFVMRLGLGVAPTEVIAGMVLNTNGNAITLSNQLREEGVDDGESLRRYIKRGYRPRKLALGVVSLYSSHHFILCRWLEQYGIDPKEDVIITVLPPEQMVRNIAAQNIDGFCVGEPWNSLAVEEGLGWCAATSVEVANGYPEKVLATTERFYAYRPDEYTRMIEVLQAACAFCGDKENQTELLRILSKSEYLNCPPKTLANALSGQFPMGFGRVAEGPFIRFCCEKLNQPDAERAGHVFDDLCRYLGSERTSGASRDILTKAYRSDIFESVLASAGSR
ncbi:CmpA/NrtA family ABC transporter substrate-binding protein [Coraliomargarita akajimensis]|uniref:Nitrate transporter, putative n=1 Tax=Coraliomargarita akajimensis (strain DSM 45221 / IAM 15411 / JCM 23193 / KCTC 12865 / 04OKA010-24) TaxID=583355 RepID=D5EMF8_CORAD|nr:CmpA/NrtA family ABC transporter substrate-binding protein [Coraliomargarita akajimensis]ADE53364.1 nitrate transporter, putative [Coraliomargarita akajimensis DSM 45221]